MKRKSDKLIIIFSALTILISVAVIILINLPGNWGKGFFVLLLTVILSSPTVVDYLEDRKKNNGSRKGKVNGENNTQEEAKIKVEPISSELQAAIDFGKRSLLIQTLGGQIYQLIKGEDKYYFTHVGDEKRGITARFLRKRFEDKHSLISKGKDYAISKEEMVFTRYEAAENVNSKFKNSGYILLRCKRKDEWYRLMGIVHPEAVSAFFEGIETEIKLPKFREPAEDRKRDINYPLIGRLKLICTVLSVVSVVVSCIFMFYGVIYKVMSILCILIFLSGSALYVKYNDILSMAEESRSSVVTKYGMNIGFILLPPPVAMLLRSAYDFNLTDYKRLIIWSVLLFSAILFIFLLFTREYKRKKHLIFYIIFVVLLFAPSAVIQINYDFNYAKADTVQARINDMYIHKTSKSPTRYLVTVTFSNGKKVEFMVSEADYDQLSIGEKVYVAQYEGFLKIPYAYIVGT